MLVKMKEYEKAALDYAERWNKSGMWDTYILIKSAFLAGYNATAWYDDVEVELGPQIGQTKPLTREQFISELTQFYKIADLRVDEKDGTISFQGTVKV